MMKKTTAGVLLAALLLSFAVFLGGCARKDRDDGKLIVLCTVFAEYDWMRQIVGDAPGVEVSLLIGKGADLHSYQSTAADIVKISGADLVATVGGSSDEWVSEAIAQANRKQKNEIVEVSLAGLDGMSLYLAEKEAFLGEDDHDHGHDHEDESFDEHIWLSLRNAEVACRAYAQALGELDSDRAEQYRENAEAYISELKALDADFAAFCQTVPQRRILVADRFPFVYLAEDYQIGYSAAFEGCTTETNAGFDTVKRLVGRADEWNVSCILVTESSDRKLAEQVIRESNSADRQILVLSSMQSVTTEQIDGGATYLSLMQQNFQTLRQALS